MSSLICPYFSTVPGVLRALLRPVLVQHLPGHYRVAAGGGGLAFES